MASEWRIVNRVPDPGKTSEIDSTRLVVVADGHPEFPPGAACWSRPGRSPAAGCAQGSRRGSFVGPSSRTMPAPARVVRRGLHVGEDTQEVGGGRRRLELAGDWLVQVPGPPQRAELQEVDGFAIGSSWRTAAGPRVSGRGRSDASQGRTTTRRGRCSRSLGSPPSFNWSNAFLAIGPERDQGEPPGLDRARRPRPARR